MIDFLQRFLIFGGLFFVLIVLIPGIFLYLVTKITQNSYSHLVAAFGNRVALSISSIGIIIHETAHLIVAKIFGHTIQDFKLIQSSKKDGLLGFVAHAWAKNNKWAVFGNFFIGIAPSVILGFLMFFDFKQILIFAGKNIWIAFLLTLVFISLSLGLSLSPQDWQTTKKGVPLFLLLFILVAFVFFVFDKKNQVINYLIQIDLLLPYLLLAIITVWIIIWAITMPFQSKKQ